MGSELGGGEDHLQAAANGRAGITIPFKQVQFPIQLSLQRLDVFPQLTQLTPGR